MRATRVRLCVGLVAGLGGVLGAGLGGGCESTKAPKGEAPKPEAAKALEAKTPDVKSPVAAAKDGQPAIANVPATDPLVMQKLEAADEAADEAMADDEDYSLEAVFPDRSLAVTDFPEKAQKRIRYKLREAAKAPIALRSLIPVKKDDGSTEVFGLYEYSVYEDCVRGYATRKEGRAQCRQWLVDGGCVKLGLVHARFGAPKAGATIETSGSLSVWWAAIEESECSVVSESAFVDDLDRDGKLEMALDLETSHYEPGERSPGSYDMRQEFFVFQGTEDGLINLSHQLDEISSYDGQRERAAEDAAVIEARDANGDGRVDFVITEVPDCVEKVMENYYSSERDAMEKECRALPRDKSVFLYDRAGDRWAKSEEVSAAWTAREAERVKEEAEKDEAADGADGADGATASGAAGAGGEGAKEEGETKGETKGEKKEGGKAEAKAKAREEAKEEAKTEVGKPAAASPEAAKPAATSPAAANPAVASPAAANPADPAKSAPAPAAAKSAPAPAAAKSAPAAAKTK